MSILIRGMEMPTSCAECLLADCSKSPCYKVGGVVDWERRPDWCPLIEIPPHGRLIDADFVIAEYDKIHVGKPGGARLLVSNAPTIIEAEEGNTWI